MDLSISETKLLCRRVLSAAGTPAGVDSETAEAIVWLASQGFPALEDLFYSIPELKQDSRNARQLQFGHDECLNISLKSDSGYITLLQTIDSLCARSAFQESQDSHASIHDVRNLALLLPLMLRRSKDGYEIHMQWNTGQVVAEMGILWMSAPIDRICDVKFNDRVNIQCTRLHNVGSGNPSNYSELNLESFDEYQSATSLQRIQIADELYWDLKEVAAQSFVPASDLSRQRGAGAEVDDSD